MKKWIGFLAVLMLAVMTGPVFADHLQPVEPTEFRVERAEEPFNQGVEALKDDNYNEAVRHFQAATQADPNLPEAHINLAMAQAAQGETEKAQKHFNEAANLIAQAETGQQQSPPAG